MSFTLAVAARGRNRAASEGLFARAAAASRWALRAWCHAQSGRGAFFFFFRRAPGGLGASSARAGAGARAQTHARHWQTSPRTSSSLDSSSAAGRRFAGAGGHAAGAIRASAGWKSLAAGSGGAAAAGAASSTVQATSSASPLAGPPGDLSPGRGSAGGAMPWALVASRLKNSGRPSGGAGKTSTADGRTARCSSTSTRRRNASA